MSFKEGDVYIDYDGDELIIGPNEDYRWIKFGGDTEHRFCKSGKWVKLKDFSYLERIRLQTPLEKALR